MHLKTAGARQRKEICRQFGVPSAFDVVEGGYVHDDGEYTEERSIVLTFIDVPQETVDAAAKEMCVLTAGSPLF